VLAHREELEARLAAIGKRYGEDPPRPPHWGGYRLIPEQAEFWQGRPNRLHDRVRYVYQGSEIWRIERLAP
jgi:pyridoxamine 5'-phosphate oxidase